MQLKLNTKLLKDFIKHEDFLSLNAHLLSHFKMLTEKTGRGNEFTGWLGLSNNSPSLEKLLHSIENLKRHIHSLEPDLIVVIGIGGSYLGTLALEKIFTPAFTSNEGNIPIIYAGHHLGSAYHKSLLDYLEDKNYIAIVISKSGTTTEPAVAFRLIRAQMLRKYGRAGSAERIIAITDKNKGALVHLAEKEGYQRFEIPDDVGGRFSVLTPVGLVPLALSGIDIKAILEGAADAQQQIVNDPNPDSNPALRYAACRYLLFMKGKPIEMLVSFEPELSYFAEWWKQLFGESEGKLHRGVFPASLKCTTDLHSLGQYAQDGLRILFETFISVEHNNIQLDVPEEDIDEDGLGYLQGKSLSELNENALKGTMLAHSDGGVPIIQIELKDLCPKSIGELIYFFEFSCAISGYLFEVNPFDQPGVEEYKKNMFALMGKSGYEQLGQDLINRIEQLQEK